MDKSKIKRCLLVGIWGMLTVWPAGLCAQSHYKVADDCTVKEVLVNEGDSVMANAALVKLDV